MVYNVQGLAKAGISQHKSPNKYKKPLSYSFAQKSTLAPLFAKPMLCAVFFVS